MTSESMKNIGVVECNGKKMVVQTYGRSIYVSGYPVEQHPREVRDVVRDFVRDRSAAEISVVPA